MKITHTELFLYLADELSAQEQVEFEQALAASPEAQKALAELHEQEKQLAQLPLQEPSRDLVAAALAEVHPRRTRLWHFPSPLLAVAALLLLLGGLFWGIQIRPDGPQVAQGPSPAATEVPVGNDELESRIAQLRSAMMKSPAPTQNPRASIIPDPAPTLMADVKTRLNSLQARCRPQMASAAPEHRPGEAPIDRRLDRIKSGMEFIREDIWTRELPPSVQAALDKAGSMWPALPLSTIISPRTGVSHSEGRCIHPDCAVTAHPWKERKII